MISDSDMNRMEIPCACTIAGSDSGGGAGIQADLKTFASLGVWGCSAITAITAQNPKEVRGVWTLPPEAVVAQIEAILDDFSVGAFKTGMLANKEIIHAVSGILPENIPVVVDPVMISTSGSRLLDSTAVSCLTKELIPRATVVTPNLEEAKILSGLTKIENISDMEAAGREILKLGAESVIVKGGHLEESQGACDVLVFSDENSLILEGVRHPCQVHGSGCCFAAAMAGYLAQGMSMSMSMSNNIATNMPVEMKIREKPEGRTVVETERKMEMEMKMEMKMNRRTRIEITEAFKCSKDFISSALLNAVPSLSGRFSVRP
ncbi:MAG: bifunctional hydroxymethylpyrimidine kinase/phosphomethylpyrimidine kinase [Euryarchaeota archaeon]|nr:bifunctional hydroxymethylpyrimidine kinase/phosphomethylpyrimidine kinase [Euryarchaeota archaeon]